MVKLGPSGTLSCAVPVRVCALLGVAVNPTNGDLYVLGEENGFFTPTTPAMIFVYDPDTGASLSSFEVPTSRHLFGLFTDVQIAADSADDVYVPSAGSRGNRVLEYSASGTPLRRSRAPAPARLRNRPGRGRLLPQSLGGRHRQDRGTRSPAVRRLKRRQARGNRKRRRGSVALDGHGDMFADVDNGADRAAKENRPACISSSTARKAGSSPMWGRALWAIQMVKVNASKHGRRERGERPCIRDRRPKRNGMGVRASDRPVVGRGHREVGASEAKLGALVSPGGTQTSYRFEYSPTAAYGSSTPFPEGSVGEGLERARCRRPRAALRLGAPTITVSWRPANWATSTARPDLHHADR